MDNITLTDNIKSINFMLNQFEKCKDLNDSSFILERLISYLLTCYISLIVKKLKDEGKNEINKEETLISMSNYIKFVCNDSIKWALEQEDLKKHTDLWIGNALKIYEKRNI